VVRFSGFSRLIVAVAVTALAVAAVSGRSSDASATGLPAAPAAASFSVNGSIVGIAASSPTNAWAVGTTTDERMMIIHWNGVRWSRLKSFAPPGQMMGISMDSPTDAWAVGWGYGTHDTWLVVHWNGKAWNLDASVPQLTGTPSAIVAVGGDVWVTGTGEIPDRGSTLLMLHRESGHWYVVPVAAPYDGWADSFAGISRTNIWAGGESATLGGFLLHWNGTAWKTVSMPKWATSDVATGMAKGPEGSVWAVGDGAPGFTMHWNGKAWIAGAVSSHETDYLNAVTFIPGGTAWAVGSNEDGSPLILHWSGKAWKIVKLPEVKYGYLQAVAATSPRNAWAVGYQCPTRGCAQMSTLILHWNGKAWS
jgi:hypothetical protein